MKVLAKDIIRNGTTTAKGNSVDSLSMVDVSEITTILIQGKSVNRFALLIRSQVNKLVLFYQISNIIIYYTDL